MSALTITLLIAFVLIETIAIILVWSTRSPWWKYNAGQVIMSLLTAQAVILGLALSTRLFGNDYPGRGILYFAGYMSLVIVMAWLGITILKAQASDRRSLKVSTEGKE